MNHTGRRRTSQLWNFFTVVDSDCATCDVCQHKLSYRGSISNLKKHLRKKHHTVLDKYNSNGVVLSKKKFSTVEDGEIEYDRLSTNSDVKDVITDPDQVPVIVEFVQATEALMSETEKSSPEQAKPKCSSNSSNFLRQTNISELYERITASACLEEKIDGEKEKKFCDLQEQYLLNSMQMERELKRRILQTELEIKREELNFKKNLHRIQLDHETKVNSLKLKMLEQNFSISS